MLRIPSCLFIISTTQTYLLDEWRAPLKISWISTNGTRRRTGFIGIWDGGNTGMIQIWSFSRMRIWKLTTGGRCGGCWISWESPCQTTSLLMYAISVRLGQWAIAWRSVKMKKIVDPKISQFMRKGQESFQWGRQCVYRRSDRETFGRNRVGVLVWVTLVIVMPYNYIQITT